MNLVQDKYVQIPEKESYLRENAGERLCFERAGHGDRADRMNGLQKSPRVDHPCQAVHPSGGQDVLRTQVGQARCLFSEMQCISHHESPRSAHTQKSKCIQVNPSSGVYKGVDASGRHLVQHLKGRDPGGPG